MGKTESGSSGEEIAQINFRTKLSTRKNLRLLCIEEDKSAQALLTELIEERFAGSRIGDAQIAS